MIFVSFSIGLTKSSGEGSARKVPWDESTIVCESPARMSSWDENITFVDKSPTRASPWSESSTRKSWNESPMQKSSCDKRASKKSSWNEGTTRKFSWNERKSSRNEGSALGCKWDQEKDKYLLSYLEKNK